MYWSWNYGDCIELNERFWLHIPCDLVDKDFTVFSILEKVR